MVNVSFRSESARKNEGVDHPSTTQCRVLRKTFHFKKIQKNVIKNYYKLFFWAKILGQMKNLIIY